ncbi:MAG: NAD+ synthase [Pyrobaculum sp.]
MDPGLVVNALDYDKARVVIVDFIREYVEGAGAGGVVVGLSGGVDSTAAAVLAVEALGRGSVLGLFMPSRFTPVEDRRDVYKLAEALGLELLEIDVDPLLEAFLKTVPGASLEDRVAVGNILPRVRMTVLYYYANRLGRLVLGTSDRSELLIGYFTKYGDGGVDLMPLGSMYKLQVRELLRRLGLGWVADKPSSPRLWHGHTAEGELGLSYEVIDSVLYALFDLKMSVGEVLSKFGKSAEVVLERVRRNTHKLKPPPAPDLSPAKRG